MRSRTMALVALVAAAVAGCALSYDKSATRLEPVRGGFVYHAYANSLHPLDDPHAEARRLAALNALLAESGLCPAGYGIIRREEAPAATGFGRSGYELRYHGRCK